MAQKPSPAKIADINMLIHELMPGITRLVFLLRNADMHEFDMDINAQGDRLSWRDPAHLHPMPQQAQLTEELTRILDQAYPPHNGFTFMNMIWNPNRTVAEKMSATLAEYRRRDKAQVEAQIIALLAAFKESQ